MGRLVTGLLLLATTSRTAARLAMVAWFQVPSGKSRPGVTLHHEEPPAHLPKSTTKTR